MLVIIELAHRESHLYEKCSAANQLHQFNCLLRFQIEDDNIEMHFTHLDNLTLELRLAGIRAIGNEHNMLSAVLLLFLSASYGQVYAENICKERPDSAKR